MKPEQLIGLVLLQWSQSGGPDLPLAVAQQLASEAVAVVIHSQQAASGIQPPKTPQQPWDNDTRGMGA